MISAGSLGKITAVLIAGLSFAGVKLDPGLVGDGLQAAIALISTIGYIVAEVKKDKKTTEIAKTAADSKAYAQVAFEKVTNQQPLIK